MLTDVPPAVSAAGGRRPERPHLGRSQPLGIPAMVVRGAFARRFVVIACPHLLRELADVLERPKFRRYFDLDQAKELVDDIAGVAEIVPDPELIEALTRDPTDDYLVALARSVEADRIVSGDADLLALTPRSRRS